MSILSLFLGENYEDPSDLPKIVISSPLEHNTLYERGSKAIIPYRMEVNTGLKYNGKVRKELKEAIRDLDAVTTYNPKNWAAFWFKGKAYQLIEEHQASNAEFKAAYDLEMQHPDIAREYASSCMELGMGAEAVRVAQHAIQLDPSDAGLLSNLALALMLDGRNPEARGTIDESLRMNPDDKISQSVRKVIIDVMEGKRKQPRCMADLWPG